MRTMLTIHMNVNAANEAYDNGSMEQTIQNLVDQVKPESCYFTTHKGKRTAYVVFDLDDAAKIPKIAEPLFHNLGAEIDIMPAMNLEDLKKGLQTGGEAPSPSA